MKDLVTICIHTGKIDYIHLFQNAIKSFLMTNDYPNIELLLVETGGNEKVRKWIENLDLYNFKNFDGTMSIIKPRHGVRIKITTLFPDLDNNENWWVPYITSLETAVGISKGKYFTYLPEDIQFVVIGDVISDYIKILKKEDESRAMIHFITQQGYKYNKQNNRSTGPYFFNDVCYFSPVELKWALNVFCNKDAIYNNALGSMKEYNKQGGVEEYYRITGMEKNLRRYYPKVFPAMWFYDDNKKQFEEIIKEKTKKNPNFILFKLHEYKDIKSYNVNKPLSTENFHIFN